MTTPAEEWMLRLCAEALRVDESFAFDLYADGALHLAMKAREMLDRRSACPSPASEEDGDQLRQWLAAVLAGYGSDYVTAADLITWAEPCDTPLRCEVFEASRRLCALAADENLTAPALGMRLSTAARQAQDGPHRLVSRINGRKVREYAVFNARDLRD